MPSNIELSLAPQQLCQAINLLTFYQPGGPFRLY
jgi:hypothetical protein